MGIASSKAQSVNLEDPAGYAKAEYLQESGMFNLERDVRLDSRKGVTWSAVSPH